MKSFSLQPDADKSILLLHGLGVYGESWGYQAQALTQAGYNPITPDLPGFGKSPAQGRYWSVRSAAEAMVRLLDREGINRTVLCGLSMGGTVALQMALSYPGRVTGLVLINTFAALRPSSVSEVAYFIRRGLRAYIANPGSQAELVAKRIFPYSDQAEWRVRLVESIRASNPKIYRQAMLSLARFDVTRHLDRIRMPVMVITGAKDTTILPRVQQSMAERIPGAQRHLIDGAGHGVIIDHMDEVNRLLLGFMSSIYPN